MKKTTKKKIVSPRSPVCPKCGYQTCQCDQTKKSQIKKSRHELHR